MLPTITDSKRSRKTRHAVESQTRRAPARPGPHCYADPVRKATANNPRPGVRAARCEHPRDTIQAPPIPPELLAVLPVWSSRKNYLAVVEALFHLPEVAAECTRIGLALQTWRRITINDAYDADTDTGHNMTTSKATAAHRVGRESKAVQRTRRLNQDLGIMVEVYRGYELSYDQRMALIRTDATHPQRGVPSSYAMVICPPRQRLRIARIPATAGSVFAQVKTNVHLPTSGGLCPLSHLLETLTITPADAVEETEPPPVARPPRRRCLGTAVAHEILAHPHMQMLQHVRPGRLAPQLGAHQGGGWHGLNLAQALIDEAARRGINTNAPALRPWGLLKTLLASIDPVYDVYAGDATAELPPPPPEPCGIAPCDGHGWINLPNAAAKCPHCPAGVRASEGGYETNGFEPDTLSDEPPF